MEDFSSDSLFFSSFLGSHSSSIGTIINATLDAGEVLSLLSIFKKAIGEMTGVVAEVLGRSELSAQDGPATRATGDVTGRPELRARDRSVTGEVYEPPVEEAC